jgi:hypothetical protein
MYYGVLSQSNISVLGTIALWVGADSADFQQHVANVAVVNFNPFSSFSNIAAKSYSGVSFESSNLKPGAYSGVTVEVNNIAPNTYSGVTVGVGGIKPASYSGVTVGIDNIKAATYSGVTVGAGDIKPAAYSGVSVGVLDIKPAAYSGVSVEIKSGGIQSASYGPSSLDAAALATDAAQEIADRLLLRNIAGGADSGRSVGEAFMALRNRTQLSNVSYIVYQNDDATIGWHASLTTTSDTVRVTDSDPA